MGDRPVRAGTAAAGGSSPSQRVVPTHRNGDHGRHSHWAERRRRTSDAPSLAGVASRSSASPRSLRHILELRPSLLKLDIHLVRDIASDPARQELVAGMRQFASEAGMRLLAEGIATTTQVETLRALAVELGPGFLLGRPAPVAAVAPGMPVGRGGSGGRRHAAR